MDTHPIAEVFPLLGDGELAELAEDIKVNGLLHPVTLYEGKVLDGRNRVRACELAQVEVQYNTFVGDWDGAVRLVTSENLRRRQLTPGQLAMAGDRLAILRNGQSDSRSAASADAADQATVAELIGSSRASLQRARVVRERGVPELAEIVERGELGVETASRLARQPEERQRDAVAEGAEGVRRAVREETVKPAPPPVRREPSAQEIAMRLGRTSSETLNKLILAVKAIEEIAGAFASGRAVVPAGYEKTVATAVERMRSGAEWIATLVQGSGFSDAALAEWLAEGGTNG